MLILDSLEKRKIMHNQEKFNKLRENYPKFIYEKYDILFTEEYLNIKYYFNIPGLTWFYPQIKIKRSNIRFNFDKEYLDYLVFQVGLIELISYVKCTCSKNIEIKCNYINEEQIKFLNKLYYNGLGEFLYINDIKISKEELFNIYCTHEKVELPNIKYSGVGNLICVGGGKDSCVSLELLRNEENNTCFIINPKTPSYESCMVAGYSDNEIIGVERILDRKIVELNEKGYLNGHTPFSAIVATTSFLVAYLNNKKNIILSNEASANEPTIPGTNINHQYSKTYEFENDFMNYIHKFIRIDIKYFSLLRGLSEFNIARIFSHYKKYFQVFKSCNVGSKEKEWKWCCNCPKCLFVYIILAPFTTLEERISIFGEDLFEKTSLLEIFQKELGFANSKPFECVGTVNEARYAISLLIKKNEEDSYLLNYYRNNYPLYLDGEEINKYNEENNLDEYYNNLVKKELNKYV